MSEINAPEIDCTPSEEKVPGSKIPEAKGHKCKYTQNREISWLRFNMRVLDEACDPAVPLMERVKFFPSSPATWMNSSWSELAAW